MSESITRIKTDIAVVAVIRNSDKILMVQQEGKNYQKSGGWSLPGGCIEDGELISEAITREVHEETGIRIKKIGELVCLVQYNSPTYQAIITLFEIHNWEGELQPNDPDGHVIKACFKPIAEVIKHQENLPRYMGESLIAYLKGEVKPGSIWLYRGSNGTDELLWRFSP